MGGVPGQSRGRWKAKVSGHLSRPDSTNRRNTRSSYSASAKEAGEGGKGHTVRKK